MPRGEEKTAFGVSLSLDSQHHPAIYWKNKCNVNILLHKASVISAMVTILIVNTDVS